MNKTSLRRHPWIILKVFLTTTQEYVKTVKGLCHMTIKRISAHDARKTKSKMYHLEGEE
jgi:hypothetical protein